MRIDVWSDVMCPWCWLGKARLEKALAEHPRRDEVEVVFHSFELDPRTPEDLDISANEMLAKKYGFPRAQIDAMHERIRDMGLEIGIDFRFDRVRTSNTFDAHQVIHLAHERGKQRAMVDRLFEAHFRDGVRVGDRAELVRLAVEVGLDAVEVQAALDERRLAPAVHADEAQARSLGVTGVPFYVFDGTFGVSGAQSVDVLRSVLDRVWAKRPAVTAEASDASLGASDDESCPI